MKLQRKEAILLHGSNLWYLGSGMFGPLLAVFTGQIGGNILDISYAWATFLIVTGVATIIVGKYSDGPKTKERLLVLGYVFNSIFTFLLITVDTPLGLLFNQFGFGISLALATPTWEALYAQYEDKKKPSLTWALFSGEAVIVEGIAILIGGAIVKFTSFQVLFITMGILQVVATLFMAQILMNKKVVLKPKAG